jgi:NDP-sugar pyrophosphorylase family protein
LIAIKETKTDLSPLIPASNDKAPMNYFSQDTRAVLLVGGKGMRLRSVVSSTPKPLASVGDRPFLELLVRQLRYQGIRRLVMCTGYLAHEIENAFGDGRAWDVMIEYSKEPRPLGTAGAVKFAEPHLLGVSDFLVMNGDSFMEIDFHQLIRFHRDSGGLASMAVLRTKNEMRYGTVRVDSDGRVSGFAEKIDSDPSGFVNAGVYVFNRRIFDHIPEGPASLEKDIFPQLLRHGIYALEQHGVFIDIGTPEDYARAQALSERLYAAVCRKPHSGSGDQKAC